MFKIGHVLSVVLVSLLFGVIGVHTQAQASGAPFVECGQIIEGEFVEDYEEHYYRISLVQGEEVNLEVRSLEREGVLKTSLAIYEPGSDRPFLQTTKYGGTGAAYVTVNGPQDVPRIETGILTTRGDFTFKVTNANLTSRGGARDPRGGAGRYTLFIGCVLRDGTVVNPGDAVEPVAADPAPPAQQPVAAPAVPVFSGYGFPGLAPVDFSNGIEVPLTMGQAQTVPVGGDIALYTFTAAANTTRTMLIEKTTPDLSVGVTVIHRDTGEIIFMGGMPRTASLMATLTFPVDGTYALGLFRLDTSTMQGTSGAVQIVMN